MVFEVEVKNKDIQNLIKVLIKIDVIGFEEKSRPKGQIGNVLRQKNGINSLAECLLLSR